MKKIFFILLSLLGSSAHAEVFKCRMESGKTVYQSIPCQSAVKQEAIEIQKPDPGKVAEAEAKLKAWQEDFAKREAARMEAEKERQAELDRKASVEALQKSAAYQKQQAYEAKRQADALERQNMQNLYQQTYPYYPTYQAFPTYPNRPHNHHNVKEKTATDSQQQPGQTEITSGEKTGNNSNRKKFIFQMK
jgi:Skp family chaperone for outer membrane proteins